MKIKKKAKPVPDEQEIDELCISLENSRKTKNESSKQEEQLKEKAFELFDLRGIKKADGTGEILEGKTYVLNLTNSIGEPTVDIPALRALLKKKSISPSTVILKKTVIVEEVDEQALYRLLKKKSFTQKEINTFLTKGLVRARYLSVKKREA